MMLAPAAAQELDLQGIVRKVERRTAQDLLLLGIAAEEDGLHATARRMFQAALTYNPENRTALRKLEEKAGKDVDPKAGTERLLLVDHLAEKHLQTVVRVCKRYGTVEERRPILEPLLLRMPRRADLHEALGHVKVGENYARPEMVEMVKLMPLRLQAWRSHATQPVTVGPSDFTLVVPGLEKQPSFHGVPGCAVATTLEPGAPVAESVARTQAFVRFLLGDDAELWNPSPVLFLQPKPYAELLRKLHPDDHGFQLYHRFANYEHRDFYAIRAASAADAAERYAHAAGYLAMYEAAAAPDVRVFAWLLEGFGYLVSLELLDRGYLSFASLYESSKKRTYTRPAPPLKTRAACRAWLREQVATGRAYPLHEVCAKSVNDLDFCASMQAYSFLRFLLLFDPEAAKRLPAELRRAKGAQIQRTERALREAYGKGLGELEPLWRAFLLEID